tara:strand:+ start:539 stop:787 length:249 start_codon:yes stop_codon:yes gene_type:complete
MNPLNISWRKFMLLLNGLPIDKSIFFAPIYQAIVNDEEYIPETSTSQPQKGWWKKELDRRRGRNRPRTTMGIDQFMNEMNQR